MIITGFTKWKGFNVLIELPFPIKNYFYKGRRIKPTIFKNWFCLNCNQFFDLPKEQKEQKYQTLADFMNEKQCPLCGSKNNKWIFPHLVKARIDKMPAEAIKEMLTKDDDLMKEINKRIKQKGLKL